MKAAIKLALRRFALRWLRKLLDLADDRLHAAEVQLREELSQGMMIGLVRSGGDADPIKAQHAAPCDRALGESLSPSAEKREQHDSWNSKARALGRTDDAGGVAQLDQQTPRSAGIASRDAQRLSPHRHHETFSEWEARRSGVQVITKREARRRRLSARAFDLRFAQ